MSCGSGKRKFPQVKPLKRGGGRRYYRPDDIVSAAANRGPALYPGLHDQRGPAVAARGWRPDSPMTSRRRAADERAAADAEKANLQPEDSLLIPGLDCAPPNAVPLNAARRGADRSRSRGNGPAARPAAGSVAELEACGRLGWPLTFVSHATFEPSPANGQCPRPAEPRRSTLRRTPKARSARGPGSAHARHACPRRCSPSPGSSRGG